MSAGSPHILSKRKLNSIRSEMSVAHASFESGLLQRALFKTNNNEVSQDLVQTTFLKTLLYLQKGGKVDLMRGFLNHVLNALIIDEYRKNKITSLDFLIEKGFELGSDNSSRVADIIDGKKIILLIPQLPPKYQQVIHMRYLKGLSLREISAITGQTENTVAVQVHRGIVKLKMLYFDT